MSSREAIITRKMAKKANRPQQQWIATPRSTTSPEQRPNEEEERVPPYSPVPREEHQHGESSTHGRTVLKSPRQEDAVVKAYAPQWGVLSTDSVLKLCPKEPKEVGPDLCRGLMLPEDRPTYEATDPLDACTEILALFSMGVPWAAAFTDKVKDLTTQIAPLELRAVRAEESLEKANWDNERLNGQAEVLASDREKLRAEVAALQTRNQGRDDQLKAARKALRKSQKLLELTEDRCFAMGFEDAVLKAYAAGFDHKQLLDEDAIDPVGREEIPDEVPVVSSGEDEAYSD